jgi:hypothetical protein
LATSATTTTTTASTAASRRRGDTRARRGGDRAAITRSARVTLKGGAVLHDGNRKEGQRDLRVLLAGSTRQTLCNRRVVKGRLLGPLLGIDADEPRAARHRDAVDRLIRLPDPRLGRGEPCGEIREPLVDRGGAPIVLECSLRAGAQRQ